MTNYTPRDREHIRTVTRDEMDRLRKWLTYPNGSCSLQNVTFEAVEHGGIWVRTRPRREGTF